MFPNEMTHYVLYTCEAKRPEGKAVAFIPGPPNIPAAIGVLDGIRERHHGDAIPMLDPEDYTLDLLSRNADFDTYELRRRDV